MTIPTVSLRIPPDADHIPLLRTAIAGIAARADLTLDEVDDLRLGVEEAAVLLLRLAGDEPIQLGVVVEDDAIEAVLSTGAGGGVDERSFSWRILTSLVDEVRATREEGRQSIVLRKVAHR